MTGRSNGSSDSLRRYFRPGETLLALHRLFAIRFSILSRETFENVSAYEEMEKRIVNGMSWIVDRSFQGREDLRGIA